MNKIILISLVIFFAICSKSWADEYIGMECLFEENPSGYFKLQKNSAKPKIFEAEVYKNSQSSEILWVKFCHSNKYNNYTTKLHYAEDVAKCIYSGNNDSCVVETELNFKKLTLKAFYSNECPNNLLDMSEICRKINIPKEIPLSGELDNKGLVCKSEYGKPWSAKGDGNIGNIAMWFQEGLTNVYIFAKNKNNEYNTMSLSEIIDAESRRICPWCYPIYKTTIDTIKMTALSPEKDKRYFVINRQNLSLKVMDNEKEDKNYSWLCEVITSKELIDLKLNSLFNEYKNKNKI